MAYLELWGNAMAKSEKEVLEVISNLLESKGIEHGVEVTVGNSRLDAYFITPIGNSVAVEIKQWEPTINNQQRAKKLAKTIQTTAGTSEAFIVFPSHFNSDINSSVVSISNLAQKIDYILQEKTTITPSKPLKIKNEQENFIFAAMPFSPEFDDTFEIAIQGAATENNLYAIRVDRENFAEDVVSNIKNQIKNSIGCIADLSGSRPNVLFELGCALALNKKDIQICSTDIKNLPFDVRNNPTMQYSIGRTNFLKNILSKKIKNVFTTEV